MKIIGIGNALMDVAVPIDNYDIIDNLKLPHGGMVMIERDQYDMISLLTKNINIKYTAGGSAANTIYGLSKLGIETSFIGIVGNDANGERYEKDLKKSGVKPILKKSNIPTGCAIALVTPDSERTFATYLGAAKELKPEDVTEELLTGYDLLYLEGYLLFNYDIVVKAMQIAKKLGMKVALDLAAHNFVRDNKQSIKDLLKNYVDICFANEEEAKSLVNLPPRIALDEISRYCDYSIVKIGPKGSLVKHNGIAYKVTTHKVKSIDTTGAGDLFAAGFIYGLLNYYSPEKCGKIGSILGSTVVQKYGARIDNDSWDIIKNSIKLI